MKNRFSGVALVTVIIFILLLSIIAIAMLNLMTNQAMLIEHQIRRIKAQYVAEAGIWKNLMRYALGDLVPPNADNTVSEEGLTPVVTYQAATGPNGTATISAQVNNY